MKILTLKTLQSHSACQSQLDLFRAHFGEAVTVTADICMAVASVFSWDWAAQKLLSPAALADYQRVRAAALADYQRVAAPALADYERVCAAAFADCYNQEA